MPWEQVTVSWGPSRIQSWGTERRIVDVARSNSVPHSPDFWVQMRNGRAIPLGPSVVSAFGLDEEGIFDLMPTAHGKLQRLPTSV